MSADVVLYILGAFAGWALAFWLWGTKPAVKPTDAPAADPETRYRRAGE